MRLNNLAHYRLFLNLSQEDVATHIHLAVPTLWRYERNIKLIRAITLKKIVDYFNSVGLPNKQTLTMEDLL